MRLHSLELSGFKSFVDPVRVDFAGGITAIVGPNGCGKSNLSDAITWVLGEQSAKTLRGARMEDVIFNGTAQRKPVGLAEVTLTLTADPSLEQAVDGRVSIGRRVFRTGVSQYRLNGKVVRLKEIKDLLMDTGLGIRAYSVIEQGKIGMILSGKPQERRKLIEEAAGVTRYKARKRLAELKLEEASANLLRLDDILSEVERAVRSLKRQASAARRYRQKERDYRELLRRVLLGRWSLLRGRLDALDGSLAELGARDAELTATVHRFEASLARGRGEIDELAGELATVHERHAELAAVIEGRQEFLKGARQRRVEIDERRQRGGAQTEERRRAAAGLEIALAETEERARELEAERGEAARQVAEDDKAIAQAEARVEEIAARLEAARRELASSSEGLERLRSACRDVESEIERGTYRRRFLDEEDGRLERQLEETAARLAEIDAELEAAEAELTTAGERREETSGELDRLLRRENELGDELRRVETELAGLRQRRRILAELSAEHGERRRELAESLRSAGLAEPRFLADLARPRAGWEEAIDHFLGDLADAVVLDPGDDGLELAHSLARDGASAVFLRPLAGAPAAAELDDPAVAAPLADALDLPAELARALPPAVLVESAADAARLAAEHPGVAAVSRERLWAAAGTLRVQGSEAAPGVLARERELDAIGTRFPEAEAELERARGERQGLIDERTRRAAELHRLDEEIAELRRRIAVGKARRADVAARRDKLAAERGAIEGERGELSGVLGTRAERRRDLESELEAAIRRHGELEAAHGRDLAELESARARREALRAEGAGHRGRLELLEERLETHRQEIARHRRQLEESHRLVAEWGREEGELEQRSDELDAGMAAAERDLQEALERRAEAQEEVLRAQELLDERRAQLRELEERLAGRRDERDRLRSEIEGLRVEQAGLRQDAEHLSATYREAFRRALPGSRDRLGVALAAEAAPESGFEEDGVVAEADVMVEDAVAEEGESEGREIAEAEEEDAVTAVAELPEAAELPEDDVELPELDAEELTRLEAELAHLKAALERLGPVNVLAAEEYDEQQERREFLATQRADVATSVESLQATIAEINETSSERFLETFAEVNRRFGEIFAKLFRGGEAEMRLYDEDDPLETGIEIVARPPGKRPQNILLLSGGEKALTAVALLFALFETKPSPFCILDEVDAPLDDVNVLRFVDTLRELSLKTQFLIITHNKLTMEVASTLYGVTMEERGISKLVAVELEHLEPVKEARTA